MRRESAHALANKCGKRITCGCGKSITTLNLGSLSEVPVNDLAKGRRERRRNSLSRQVRASCASQADVRSLIRPLRIL